MDALIGGIVIVLLVLGFMPGARGVAAAIDSVENPSRPETQAERDQAHSDMWRLLVVVVGAFGLLFALQMGG